MCTKCAFSPHYVVEIKKTKKRQTLEVFDALEFDDL